MPQDPHRACLPPKHRPAWVASLKDPGLGPGPTAVSCHLSRASVWLGSCASIAALTPTSARQTTGSSHTDQYESLVRTRTTSHTISSPHCCVQGSVLGPGVWSQWRRTPYIHGSLFLSSGSRLVGHTQGLLDPAAVGQHWPVGRWPTPLHPAQACFTEQSRPTSEPPAACVWRLCPQLNRMPVTLAARAR